MRGRMFVEIQIIFIIACLLFNFSPSISVAVFCTWRRSDSKLATTQRSWVRVPAGAWVFV